EALETFKILNEKYDNARLVVRCKMPVGLKEQYRMKNVEFLENQLEFEELKKLYANSDALIMPGYGGYSIMAYLEAFSYGLPIIALDSYGTSEFILEGKT